MGRQRLVFREPDWNSPVGRFFREVEVKSRTSKPDTEDLAQRGPGEFLGTRQSGLGDFRLANLARDTRLLLEARQEAQAWLQKDPNLERCESAVIREVLRHEKRLSQRSLSFL